MDFELPPCPPLDEAAGEPPEIVQEAMRRHRREIHGLGFQLGRDVEYPGHSPARATLAYIPPTVKAGARYRCSKPGCEHTPFIVTGPPYGDPGRNAFLLLWEPGLRAATKGLSAAEREAYIEVNDRGELARHALHASHARGAKQVAKRTRPADKRRIEGAQKYMLQQRTRVPRDDDAVWDLVRLQQRDPTLFRKVTGGDKKIAFDTARRHMQRIPADLKTRARRRWEARSEIEKQRLIEERDKRS
jgi:hypothetical protein